MVPLDQMQVNRLWEAVSRTSRELVWELDPHGIMRYMNDAALDVLGALPADLVGRSVFDVIHPDDVDRAAGILTRCLDRRVGWENVRVRVHRPDGSHAWVETSSVAHVGSEGQLLGFTATTRRLDSDDARAAELSLIRERIEEILHKGRLRTVWQPIFSLDTGAVVGAEALSRFGPASAPYPPDRCFADAFAAGLGVELEALAVERALSAAREFPAGIAISVNAAPQTVATGILAELISGSGIAARRMIVELTEHVSIDDYEAISAPLTGLRDMGVHLAVDDAGAGFASFCHILRLKPDIIKLDQSITRGITDNPAQRALAAALVLFALEVGSMTITAEGVETAEDLRTVSTLGVDSAQGYYMARPVPAEVVDWNLRIDEVWFPAGQDA